MELWRRWILLICIVLGIGMAKFATLAPVVSVKPVDFAVEQKDESLLTERGQYLAQLPLEDYIGEVTKGILVPVAGAEWEEFFKGVEAASQGGPIPDKWLKRVSPEDKRWGFKPDEFFFRPGESPLKSLAGNLLQDHETKYLALEREGKTQYLSLTLHRFSNDDFRFGSGFSHYPKPPTHFVFPYRRFSLGIILLGLLLYIFLPRRRRKPDSIYYPAWRVILGDFASLLLFATFFFLPILIVGGTLQAFTEGWIFIIVFWPLAFAGVWLLWFMAWYASYEIVVRNDGLELSTHRERKFYPFSAMNSYQPLLLKPPRWLVILSWVGVLLGRGSARLGQAGRAAILSGTAYQGIGIRNQDGSSIYFWLTDQVGGRALKNAQKMIAALEKQNVPKKDEIKTIESITMPDGEPPAGEKKRMKRSNIVLFGLLISPFVVLVLLLLIFSLNKLWLSHKSDLGKAAPAEKQQMEAQLLDSDIEWERTFSAGDVSVGNVLMPTPDGGFFLAGYVNPGGTDVDFYAVKTDSNGEQEWSGTFGAEEREFLMAACPTQDGGFILAGESGSAADLTGLHDVYLVKLDSLYKKEWERTYGAEEADEDVYSLEQAPDGEFVLCGKSGSDFYLLRVDGQGNRLDEKKFAVSGLGDTGEILWAQGSGDGGFILAGEILNPGIGFKDLLLVKLDAEGNEEWRRTFGGKQKESADFVRQTSDGGYAACGVAQSFGSGGDDLYLVRVDADGQPLWEKTFGGPGNESGRYLEQTEDGGFIVAGTAKLTEDSPGQIYIVKTDAAGDLEWEKTIGKEKINYSATYVARTSDGGYAVLGTKARGDFFQTDICLLKIKKP